MRKSLSKKILSTAMVAILAMQIAGSAVTASALEMPYKAHSVYEHSEYYEKLCAVELTENLRENILNIAMSQLGYHEGNSTSELDGTNLNGSNNYTEYGYWFGTQVKGNSYGHFYDWCAMFVSWCARQAQIPTNVISNSAYANASSSVYCFNNMAYRARGTYTPIAGDIIFFDWDGLSDSWDHVGLVYDCDGSSVYTIEGNSSNMVAKKEYPLDKEVIRGYGIPSYDGEIVENKIMHQIYNNYTPMKSYPCVTHNFEVKKDDYSSRAGEIYTTDLCTISSIYDDGWCKVTFPLDSGGTITGYTPLSNFIYDTNYEIVPYITDEELEVYTKKELNESLNWRTGAGDTIYIVSEFEDALQICYSIDDAYGGGYKLGWFPRTEIPEIPDVPIPPDIEIESIDINSFPKKTEYLVGEKFDESGLSINLIFSDGTSKTISKGFTVSSPDMSTAGAKAVTVAYEDKTVAFEITVENTDVVVYSISVQSKPTKTTYKVGETFSSSGLSVKVNMSDGTSKTVTSGFTVSSPDMSTAGTKTVTVTYEGKTTTFTITVNKNVDENAAQVVVESKRATKGSEITVAVKIKNNPGITSMRLHVAYDTSVLTLTNVTDGGIIGTKNHPDNLSVYPYILSWANDTVRENFTSDGTIATLTFAVSPDAEFGDYEIKVSYDNELDEITNVDMDVVDFTPIDGIISISNVLIGDVNGDGKITSKDRIILSRYLDNWEGYETLDNPLAADINSDGKITSKDRIILSRFLDGWGADYDIYFE